MATLTMTNARIGRPHLVAVKKKRIESIDLLRGVVMIIMALDHVRDYFHKDAFFYNPEDLNHTNAPLFFTRWITHFCASVFIFLAGVSAYLFGVKKSKKELSFFLFTRGIWLAMAELLIISLFRTFNPSYHFLNLQVIWVIGLSMIILSAMVQMRSMFIGLIGLLIITCHNLLDHVHVPGTGALSFLWALLHDPGYFTIGPFTFHLYYPLLPWFGIMAAGYGLGSIYEQGYTSEKRKKTLLYAGVSAIAVFIILRLGNFYGDAVHWSIQKNQLFSMLSFLNTTKYPPSLLYILMTLGPSFIFLAFAEKSLNRLSEKIVIFGRVPMFYYLAHILLIHLFSTMAAVLSGYKLSDMVLTTMVNREPELKGYGFHLIIVYAIWAILILILFPICKWFDSYKRKNSSNKWWLTYL